MSQSRRAALVLLMLVAVPCSGRGIGLCMPLPRPPSLRETAEGAKLIVYGSMANPRQGKAGPSTDCLIARVIRPHRLLGDKKVLRVPCYIEVANPKNLPTLVIFCDIDNGKLDPYRGVQASPAVVDYLRGLLARNANDVQRLLYCFDFIEHADPVIAADALLEFQTVSLRELGQAARQLPPAKLRVWLKNPKTSPDRLVLYSFLLGHCGKPADKSLVRGTLERLRKKEAPGNFDWALVGYTLLAPREGWTYARDLMGKPANDFMVRYAGLRAARFFCTTRPDVIGKRSVLEAVRLLLDQSDLADLAIEDFRHWRHWDYTAQILALHVKFKDACPAVRRAILRYALRCPGPEAAAFLADRRKDAAEMVEEQKEVLGLEKQR